VLTCPREGVIPDWQIPLTERGKLQAREASRRIVELLGAGQAVIYYSPYTRTVETLDQILEAIPLEQVCIVQEEPRIREQDFGNYQDNTMQDIKKERARFGRFFYRFPEGESGADGTSFLLISGSGEGGALAGCLARAWCARALPHGTRPTPPMPLANSLALLLLPPPAPNTVYDRYVLAAVDQTAGEQRD
jgi:hypothetical protein